ncbi:MAG TPA: HAMP domain-containing sensor histidine kinase [Bryobacteraceae bacterium]|nr:HAMP domain-containing sensor histidine kinase [Bryobacteraceae bacterium]
MPSDRKSRSIAFRLITAVLAVEFASSLLVGFLSFGYERHIHFDAFEITMRGRADTVLGAVQDAEDPGDNIMLDRADVHVPSEDVYEAYDEHGRLLGRSPNWQGMGAPPAGDHRPLHVDVNGRNYRVIVRHGSRIVDPGEPGGGKLRKFTVLYGAPTGRVWVAIRGAVEFYAIASILLLAVTGPLIAWLLHRGLLPLRQLASLSSRVSADSWQFSPPGSARATPELAPLTAAIENVLQRLERSFNQQRTFVSDAAHELKTAVAVVKSSLQLLALRPRTAAEYQAGIDRSLADTERLEDLVAKMLTLARVEAGGSAQTTRAAADLAQCLREGAAELESVAELRKVRVNLELPAGEPVLVAVAAEDCSLLISNLLLNALQHSPPDSTVEARIAVQHGPERAVEFCIEDHGDGIDPAALPHVLDRFYRGDPSRNRATGGAGLGLAICKAIAERAGGSIAIASRPGEGTTVSVRLPLAQEATVDHALASA